MGKLISLDVFDTALFRKVYRPTDIFRIIENEIGHNFYSLRVEAQNKAAKRNAYYNVFDIYSFIPRFDLKEEIKAEYSNCKANPYILDMYNNSKDEFIFISDMYLPEKVIVGMLERCGYKNPRVFVSCDYNAVKGDGKLFKVVEEVIGRKINKHIGDNYNCDILGAKRAGIQEVEFVGPPIYNKEVITPELSNPRLRKLLIDEELSNSNTAEKIGYLFAPLVYSFTKKVLDEARDGQTVFFNARDCFLMYVTARWIFKTKKKIKYCRFSRKSCLIADIITNKPITDKVNDASLHFLKIMRVSSLRDFIKVCRLEESYDYSRVLEEFGISLDSKVDLHPKRNQIIDKFILYYQDIIYKRASEDRINFIKYLKNIGIRNNDIFVDVGYAATIQGIIKRITGIDLRGIYVNTYTPNGDFKGIPFRKESFLPMGFIRNYTGAILEVVFSESKGTVVAHDNTGKPILLKDTKVRKDITKAIAKGALRGVRDIYSENISVSMEDSLAVLKRYLDTPSIDEATFMNQPIFENGSCDNFESLAWYSKDLIKQGKLKECYNRSYWKNAFKVLLQNDPEFKFLYRFIK